MILDFLAVFVATILSVLFGLLYYSKYVAGDIWMEEVGISKLELKQIKQNLPMTLCTVFVLNFCTAVLMDFLFVLLGLVTVKESIFYAILFWVGFFGVTTLANNLLEGRSFQLFIIKMIYQLLSFILMGVVLILI